VPCRCCPAQIRALARLSWFFLTGTTAQLIAIGIVVYELLQNPDPQAKTELVRVSGHYERQFVAIFNMVFAYGGQFAFTGECVCERERLCEGRGLQKCLS
jgi:hypothetical protein